MYEASTTELKPIARGRWWEGLGAQVLIGIALGAGIGLLAPAMGADLKILGDIFLRLIKTVVAPLVFLSVVLGIITGGDIRKTGRVGLISFIYFELVAVAALATGLLSAIWSGVGLGVNATVAEPNAAVAKAASHSPTVTSFILNMFPDNFVGAFTRSELLQVLIVAIILAVAVLRLPPDKRAAIESGVRLISEVLFHFIDIVMKFAPIGAFGAIAFAVSTNGGGVVFALAYLVLIYWVTVLFFISIVFGLVLYSRGLSLFEFLTFFRSEIILALGTASSESVFPRLYEKLEALGCSKQTVSLVLPLGYAFNLDGTAIYMPMGVVFIANAYGVHLSVEQLLAVCALMLVTSKGAATVSGGTFVVFAATVAATNVLPLSGVALLFGVLRLQAPATVLCNVLGNCVATIFTATYTGEFDVVKARAALSHSGESRLME
jgi:aerobic C4-dicarboxylate transport protein